MRIILKSGLLPIILVLLVLVLSCEQNNIDDQPDYPDYPADISVEIYQKEVIDSANNFAFDLFRALLDETKGMKNIIISPFNVSCALSMTLNGAHGETFDAMKKALRVEEKTLTKINDTYLKLLTEMVPVDERVELDIINSVWVEKRLIVKQDFITDLVNWYKTEVLDIDVEDPDAVQMVNDWIADKTNDKITDMLDYLDPELAMLLINAVYFKGMWTYQFDISNTEEELFYIDPSTPVTVNMMHQTADLKALKANDVTIVDIPYGRDNYSMLVVLPEENVDISDVSDSLTYSQWDNWMDLLVNTGKSKVELSMPRFKYKYKKLLNNDLINLGMGIAFSDFADFYNISIQELKINRVIHQSFIEVNEEGTEAAAATVVEIIFRSGAGPAVITKVEINRPFLYFIHENSTGTILFMGKVSDPTSEN